ncbi:MAG: phosphoribosyl-AMP cyclohydrolase [Mailhella sp.]|nr:phosphoribosyl-AMP cyclohydrolase [Mailhella sp.]
MPSPDFAKCGGLVPAIAQDAADGEVLMLAYMNEEAWNETLATGFACYYSRSRCRLWRKGEESGNRQKVLSVRLDCDADTVLLLVEQTGPACHEGYKSCFFRELDAGKVRTCSPKLKNPEDMYGSKQPKENTL